MKGHNRRNSGRASSVPEAMLWGLGIAAFVITAGSVLMAKLLDSEVADWKNSGYGIMGILIAAAFLGGVTACSKVKIKRLRTSLLFGGILWLILLTLTAVFFGGQYDGAAVTGALILGSSVCAGLLGGNTGKGRIRRKIQSVRS